jgi:hypothetical protein
MQSYTEINLLLSASAAGLWRRVVAGVAPHRRAREDPAAGRSRHLTCAGWTIRSRRPTVA